MIVVKAPTRLRESLLLQAIILFSLFCGSVSGQQGYTPTASSGQAQRIVFTHLNVENGLSQNSVLAIAQDNQGFMWLGNRFGLNRYDGHHFRIYQSNDSDLTTLSNNYIVSLLADSHGVLWVGTSNGLNWYDRQRDRFNRIIVNPAAPPGQDNNINCLFEDSHGRIWIGTAHGLLVIPPNSGYKTISIRAFNEYIVRAVFEDHEGYIWVGTNNGLTRMAIDKAGPKEQNGDTTLRTFRHEGPGTISDNLVTAIAEDSSHTLWFGTLNGGMNRYNARDGSFTTWVHCNNIRKITADRQGRLWIGTLEGLTIMDPATLQWNSYQHDPGNRQSLSQNSIYSIFRDANGSMWIGTYFGGVNITYSYTTPFNVYENTPYRSSISNNVISTFAEDTKHNLWIGTEGGGLNYYDRRSGNFTAYRNKPGDPSSLGSNLVKAVCQDRDGNIWVGTHGGGLNLFEPGTGSFTRLLYKENDAATLGSEIAAIMEDHDGQLWIGSQTGLQIFGRTHAALLPYKGNIDLSSIRDKSVKVLFEDSRKNIWIATTSGLFRLRNGTFRIEEVLSNKGPHGVNANFINCIREDSRGRIWIGKSNEGLAAYDTTGHELAAYTVKDGLPNNNVLGILEDSSRNLWLSTDNGLSRFDPDKKIIKNYTTSDGLLSNEFNYNSFFKDSRGELFFGGYSGFISFFPGRIETNNYEAPIVFTSLKLFNEPVTIGQDNGLLDRDISQTRRIIFHHNQNVFTLDFALLNYIKSGKNKYACKLDGFDREWNDLNVSSVTYTSLPAGNYTLLVKGANNDGVWSRPISLQIIILPPFWRTWWAYCIYFLAFLGLVFLIARYFFLRELLKREEGLHQAKLNFFTNISHEIRTHLALIIGPVEKLLLQGRDKGDKEITRELAYVKKNSDSLLQLVSELMEFRKAESGHLQLQIAKGNLVSFVREIFMGFENLAETRKIKIEFIAPAGNIEAWYDREQLAKVFYNLLTNAFKFTPDGGRICVRIEEEKKQFSVRVIDNGKGIAPENLEKLFLNYFQEKDDHTRNTGYGIGLAFSRSIMELHHGDLLVESDTMQGAGDLPGENRTCFTVVLLAGKEHFSPEELLIQPMGSSNFPDRTTDPVLNPQEWTTDTDRAPVDADKKLPSILVVEDNPDLRAFIRDALTEYYSITEVSNGNEGWQYATEQIPDLIISDVTMPEMDGFELCGRLKTDERTSHIPVILLTARTSTANQVSGLQMGADIYLTKPFSIHILILHIRNQLLSREKMREKFSQEFTLQPKNIIINTIDEQFLAKAIQVIEDNMEDPEFGVQVLSTHMAMSQPVLYKKLKALTDMSVNDFIKSIRLKKAAQLLGQKQHTVYEVAYMVGYNDRKYFSREFKKQFGKTPSEYADT